MAIWVDADACPNVIKEILFRAAERTQTPLTLVANQPLRVPPSRFIRTLRVEQGFDVADNEIVRQCAAGDLVITADIPLAAEVLAKGGAALNPRGERYSEATIRERLTMRDFMETLRASGVQTGGPDSLSQRDRQQFAAELEKWLLAVKRRRWLNPAIVIAAKIIVAKAGVEVVVRYCRQGTDRLPAERIVTCGGVLRDAVLRGGGIRLRLLFDDIDYLLRVRAAEHIGQHIAQHHAACHASGRLQRARHKAAAACGSLRGIVLLRWWRILRLSAGLRATILLRARDRVRTA